MCPMVPKKFQMGDFSIILPQVKANEHSYEKCILFIKAINNTKYTMSENLKTYITEKQNYKILA